MLRNCVPKIISNNPNYLHEAERKTPFHTHIFFAIWDDIYLFANVGQEKTLAQTRQLNLYNATFSSCINSVVGIYIDIIIFGM